MDKKTFNTLECMLFVAGDPVPVAEIARVMQLSRADAHALLAEMERVYRGEERGVQLLVTDQTAQLVSNGAYIDKVETLMQPLERKSVSQSILETLAVVAYRQPVTRADIENIRGVRCDYAVGQLVRLGLIMEVGRRDAVGRPVLFGTTDKFLRQFGLHSLDEMPEFLRFSGLDDGEAEQLTV